MPTLPDGKRDVDHEWSLIQTWKQMEGLVKKGEKIHKSRPLGVRLFAHS